MSIRRSARAAGALVTLAALACVQACTPADRPVTALRQVNGHPALLIVSCPDFQVDHVVLYRVQDASPRPQWEIDRDSGTVSGEVRLLEAPAGWSVRDRSLTAITEGDEYTVWAFDRAHPTVPIHFTLAEVAALDAGQVLVGKPNAKREAVSEAEFRNAAKRSC